MKKHYHQGKTSEGRLDKNTVITAAGICPGQVVLDAGYGNGYMSKEFSRLVGNSGKVYALDPDENAIALLSSQILGTNVTAIAGDITTTTNLPAGLFDFIYLAVVVHGFSAEEFKGFEKEVKRLLAPNGKLGIVEFAKQEASFDPSPENRFSPEELKRSLDFAELETVMIGERFYLQLFENKPRA